MVNKSATINVAVNCLLPYRKTNFGMTYSIIRKVARAIIYVQARVVGESADKARYPGTMIPPREMPIVSSMIRLNAIPITMAT